MAPILPSLGLVPSSVPCPVPLALSHTLDSLTLSTLDTVHYSRTSGGRQRAPDWPDTTDTLTGGLFNGLHSSVTLPS